MKGKPLSRGLSRVLERKLLVCPHCGQILTHVGASLACSSRHSFDVARQGYVNLVVGGQKSSDADVGYSAEFVQARRNAIERGFFSALVCEVSSQILHYCGKRELFILDAGSGEGSLFELLAAQLLRQGFAEPRCLGIDLAVPGVRYAAGRLKEHAWCVADLAHIPCADGAIDVVLNILSPANYAEFARVLKPGGIVIKVVPTASHLVEIREAVHAQHEFSNARVVEHFGASVRHVASVIVQSSVPCGHEGASRLFHMTPLSWQASEQQRQAFFASPPESLTVSFELLVGRVS